MSQLIVLSRRCRCINSWHLRQPKKRKTCYPRNHQVQVSFRSVNISPHALCPGVKNTGFHTMLDKGWVWALSVLTWILPDGFSLAPEALSWLVLRGRVKGIQMRREPEKKKPAEPLSAPITITILNWHSPDVRGKDSDQREVYIKVSPHYKDNQHFSMPCIPDGIPLSANKKVLLRANVGRNLLRFISPFAFEWTAHSSSPPTPVYRLPAICLQWSRSSVKMWQEWGVPDVELCSIFGKRTQAGGET